MKGIYKGALAIILLVNREAIYFACTCHSLNLCGEQGAEICFAAITYFLELFKNDVISLVQALKDGKP